MHGTDDIVRLNLIESYCLPLLTYGVNAGCLKSSDYVDLNTCWNSVFRRIFHFHKHESVRVFMCGLGRLDFIHLCHKMRLTFIRKGLNSANQSVKFVTRLFIMGHDFMKLCVTIDVDAMHFYKLSFGSVTRLVYNHFRDSCLE